MFVTLVTMVMSSAAIVFLDDERIDRKNFVLRFSLSPRVELANRGCRLWMLSVRGLGLGRNLNERLDNAVKRCGQTWTDGLLFELRTLLKETVRNRLAIAFMIWNLWL